MVTCPSCGVASPGGSKFCTGCGQPLPETARAAPAGEAPAPPEAAPPPGPSVGPITRALAWAGADPSGFKPAILVVLVCAAISYVGWAPLCIPIRALKATIPQVTCSDLPPGSVAMYVCSAKVGLVALILPVAIMVAFFVLRGAVARLVTRATQHMPSDAGFLLTPVIATVFFTLSWAALHLETGAGGYLPQKAFPAVIGLFTYCTVRFGPAVQQSLRRFFDVRDQIPVPGRYVLMFLVPAALAFLLTFGERSVWITQTAEKEQLIVVVSLLFGFALLAPRQGNLAEGVRELVGVRNSGAAPEG